jgi:hypothetical protein
VIRVDSEPCTAADVRADIRDWSPPPGPWDLVWASPPCTSFSTANHATRDLDAGMELVFAAIEIIKRARPRWWVIENVHGSTRAIAEVLGPYVAKYGSFYLWGVFPPFDASVPRTKTKITGRRAAERRAAIPWAISDGLIRACEVLADELGAAAPGVSSGGARASSGAGADAGQHQAESSSGGARASGGAGALAPGGTGRTCLARGSARERVLVRG